MAKPMITRALTADGSARIIFADTTEIVEKAREIHGASKTVTAALGRVLTAASLMGSLLKDKENTLTLQFNGDGPAGRIVTVSDYKGNVRGYADNPTAELPPNAKGKLDVGGIIGAGSLYVVKDLGMNEPYVGVSPIVTGEVAEDITEYFASSEQIPTVCALGVRVGRDHSCYAAGGFLIQLLPGADEATISTLEKTVSKIRPVSDMIADGMTASEIIAAAFEGLEYDLFDEFDIGYECTCSREKYLTALAGMNDADLDEIGKDGEPVEACCNFCGSKYVFTMDEIFDARKAKMAKRAERHADDGGEDE